MRRWILQNSILMVCRNAKIKVIVPLKRIDNLETYSRDGAILGTPAFMSPEQRGSPMISASLFGCVVEPKTGNGPMPKFEIISTLKADNVRSLLWQGEHLVDWASGIRYQLDGNTIPRNVVFSYRFDSACSSQNGEFTVLYEKLGTKAILLRHGKILRELNRSFYQADVYEYPVCFARLDNDRDVLIHCPDEYNQIELELAETGERITASEHRDAGDFFHSRLAVDQSGQYLLSAGWVWHPFDAICLWNLQNAIMQPKLLDTSQLFPPQSTEVSSAAFTKNNKLILATSAESFADEEDIDTNDLLPSSVAVWDIDKEKLLYQTKLDSLLGNFMSVDENHVVDFFEHPKIVSLKTGEILDRLKDIDSGKQRGSIIHHLEALPPTAFDTSTNRFAIATKSEIVVVQVRV